MAVFDCFSTFIFAARLNANNLEERDERVGLE